jgi:hypothetical protein
VSGFSRTSRGQTEAGLHEVRLKADTTNERSTFIGQREDEQRVPAGDGDVLFAVREE